MQMCFQCDNEIEPSSEVGMLFPCYIILRRDDHSLLLPGMIILFLIISLFSQADYSILGYTEHRHATNIIDDD